PRTIQKGGRLLLDVPNRGRPTVFSNFNRAEGAVAGRPSLDLGDGFVQRHGFTVAWCGWQHDVLPQPGVAAIEAPHALIDGRPVPGPIMSEYQPTRATKVLALAPGFRAYPAADIDEPGAVLAVRDHLEAPRCVIPRDRWCFGRLDDGRVVPDRSSVYLA